MTQAANGDLQSLVSREQSRAEIVRHATKLEHWTRDRKIAFDVPVVSVAGTEFFEARLTDQFGLSCGLSLILWDDVSFQPDGRIWILVICHHHEVCLSSTLAITETRRSIVEECDDTSNRPILE
jgi:hypothetical protein